MAQEPDDWVYDEPDDWEEEPPRRTGPSQDEILAEAKKSLGPAKPAVLGRDTSTETDNPLRAAYDEFTKPLWTQPAKWGKQAADYMNTLGGEIEHPGYAAMRGFGAGVLEGLGGVVSDATNPLDLIALLASGGGSLAAKTIGTGSRALRTLHRIEQGAEGIMGAHGAETALNPFNNKSASERAFGVAEGFGGAAGVLGSSPSPEAKPTLTPGEDLSDWGGEGNFGEMMPPNAPDLETYKQTNNQDRIVRRHPTAELTDNSGETIKRLGTRIEPTIRPEVPPEITPESLLEQMRRGEPLPVPEPPMPSPPPGFMRPQGEIGVEMGQPPIEPEVLPSPDDVSQAIDTNEVRPEHLEVIRQEALQNASDADILEAVDSLNQTRAIRAQSGAPGTRQEHQQARILEMELRARQHLQSQISPDPYVPEEM